MRHLLAVSFALAPLCQATPPKATGIPVVSSVFAEDKPPVDLYTKVPGIRVILQAQTAPEAVDLLTKKAQALLSPLGLIPVPKKTILDSNRGPLGNKIGSLNRNYHGLLRTVDADQTIVFRPRDVAAAKAILDRVTLVGSRAYGRLTGTVNPQESYVLIHTGLPKFETGYVSLGVEVEFRAEAALRRGTEFITLSPGIVSSALLQKGILEPLGSLQGKAAEALQPKEESEAE